MSYLGSSAAPLAVAFSGPQSEGFDGGTATFTLSRSVSKVTDIEVVINNVAQSPYDGSYSVSDKTLTTSETVSAGTKNVIVKYRDVSLGSLVPTPGSVGKPQLDGVNLDGTGAMLVPSGSTAQRPASPVAGMTRFNTTTAQTEIYQNGAWSAVAIGLYSIDYLVVAGGGSGGINGTGAGGAGGGGAGGYISATSQLVSTNQTFSLVVGAGGAAKTATGTGQIGNQGNNSAGFGQTAIGGGYGSGAGQGSGGNGGSGGGGVYTAAGGSGTTGQGNAGGAGDLGGGGGAGAAGTAASGPGGTGLQWLNGTYYAGGGGGTNTGGVGGGANGTGTTQGPAGQNGVANTGGGGGGSYPTTGLSGGAGGSGVVIVRYLGSQRGSGGSVSSAGGYTYHTFTSSGTFTA